MGNSGSSYERSSSLSRCLNCRSPMMRQLSMRAQAYLYTCYLLGLVAFGWLLLSYHGPLPPQQWFHGGALAILSAACQVFVVARTSTTGQRSDHLTPAPLFAALLLVPRPI